MCVFFIYLYVFVSYVFLGVGSLSPSLSVVSLCSLCALSVLSQCSLCALCAPSVLSLRSLCALSVLSVGHLVSVTATDDAKHVFFTRLADRGFERATFSVGQARTYRLDQLNFSTKNTQSVKNPIKCPGLSEADFY